MMDEEEIIVLSSGDDDDSDVLIGQMDGPLSAAADPSTKWPESPIAPRGERLTTVLEQEDDEMVILDSPLRESSSQKRRRRDASEKRAPESSKAQSSREAAAVVPDAVMNWENEYELWEEEDEDEEEEVGLTAAERKKRAAKARKAEREAARVEKRKAAELEKQGRAAERHIARQESGAFAEQEILVSLEDRLERGASRDFLEMLERQLDEKGVGHIRESVGYGAEFGSGLVRWRRRVMVAPDTLSERSSVEPFAMLVWSGEDVVRTLQSKGVEGLEEAAVCVQSNVEAGTRVFFLFLGASRAAVSGGGGRGVTLDSIEEACMHLYVFCHVETVRCESIMDAADEVQGLTRAIAMNPFRTRPNALACVNKVRVDWTHAADLLGIDTSSSADNPQNNEEDEDETSASERKRPIIPWKRGRGGKPQIRPSSSKTSEAIKQARKSDPRAIFFAQLQMIRGISPAKAAAIAKVYPTVGNLFAQYNRPELTEKQKQLLLSEIINPGRKEPTLSKRIYSYYTATDPDALVD